MITEEMIEVGYRASLFASKGEVRKILAAALSASPAGPFEMRHEEGGYVEFLNEDVPTVVREIDGRVAILTTLEQPRKVVGYRVYDPGSSPSEVFGSASPAGVVKPLEEYERQEAICTDAALSQWERSLKRPDMQEKDRVRGAIEAYKRQALAFHMLPARIMSAIEPAGVRVETVRHKKRGTTYEVIGVGKMQAENWEDVSEGRMDTAVDMREVTIYRSTDDGQIWVRPVEEFNDGRFERAAPKGDEQ